MLNILITGITSLLADISTEMVYPLIPLYLASLGAQPTILGIIEGFAESSACLLRVFSGSISDRLARRKPIAIIGYAGSALGKLLLYISNGWTLVFAGRMVDRIGKGIRVAPRDALIADSTVEGRRGRAFGLHRALDTFGASLGVLIAILLVNRLGMDLSPNGYQRIFLISLVPALLAVTILFFARETGLRVAGSQPPRLSLKKIAPKLRNFLFIVSIFSMGNSSNQFLLLRMRSLGWTAFNILMLYLLYNITYAFFSYPCGQLADRTEKKRLLAGGYFIYALTYFGFALLKPSGNLAWLLFGVYGLYSALTEGLEKSLVADIAPVNQRATFIGLHATLTGIGLLPASIIAGGLWTIFGPNAPFLFGGLLGLGAGLCLLILL
ncbi:MAG: MFS transporter [bacterium]